MDVKGQGILWSCKYTTKRSFPVSIGTLREVEFEAQKPGGPGATPALAIEVNDETTGHHEDYVVLRLEDFIALFQDDFRIAAQPSTSEKRREEIRLPPILRRAE